jgi:hypothetical protein
MDKENRMNPEEADQCTRGKMQGLARFIDGELPSNWGFVIMAFPFGDSLGRMNYVSNGNRDDVVAAMKEFIKKTEAQWGKHIQE